MRTAPPRHRGVAWLQVRTDSCQDGQAQQLVAQKYLERPLLAFQRKFDLRQWVLVSSWEPLTVWFYRRCYLRFCAEDYKPSNFDNIFCHLSNNSIAKKSQKFKTGALPRSAGQEPTPAFVLMSAAVAMRLVWSAWMATVRLHTVTRGGGRATSPCVGTPSYAVHNMRLSTGGRCALILMVQSLACAGMRLVKLPQL